jgi:preprotein translocase subunit SecD
MAWKILTASLLITTVAFAEPVLEFAAKDESMFVESGDLLHVTTAFDYDSKPVVNLRLSPEKAKEFGALSGAHIGEPIDIIVCGQVISSPVIRDPIRGGALYISGSQDTNSANILAQRLKTGICSAARSGTGKGGEAGTGGDKGELKPTS